MLCYLYCWWQKTVHNVRHIRALFFVILHCYFYLPKIKILQKEIYYVRHKAETHENRRFFSTGMEFAENAYAYVLKAPSRS